MSTKSLFLTLAIMATLPLGGCGVPEVEDPDHIVVDGEPMVPRAFLEKYCQGRMDDKTCIKVMRAARRSGNGG